MKIFMFLMCFVLASCTSGKVMMFETREQAAEALVDEMGYDKQMNGGVEAMLPLIDGIGRKNRLSPKEMEQVKDVFRDWINEDFDKEKMKDEVSGMYAEAFTIQELSEIIAFYRTKTGSKVLDLTPDLTKKAAMLGMQEAKEKEYRLRERLDELFIKLGR